MPRVPRARAPSEDTRSQIVEAALETLRSEGIVGTTTRAIARNGGFHQSLIHYHFQSVWGALLAGVDRLSEERRERYVERLEGVRSLPEFVRIAADLHREDTQEGHITVLAQMLAGSAADPGLERDVRAKFDPWIELVADAVKRVVSGTRYEGIIPPEDLGLAVTALFLGIELLTHTDREGERAASLFATLGAVAAIIDALLFEAPPAPPARRRRPSR